jgi:HSP20 family protein
MAPHRPAHEVELFREDDAYVVYVDLPTSSRPSVEVRTHGQRLSITARTDEGHRIRRRLGVPYPVGEDVTACYEDGVLEVTVPIENGVSRPGETVSVV